jgi:hypothetical protein
VHEIVAVCGGVVGMFPPWLASLFPLRAGSIEGLQAFQFPIESRQFRRFLEYIFYYTTDYMQIVHAAGLFRKYRIITIKSVRVQRGEDGTGTTQTNALWVHDVPGKDFQIAETYHRM